MSATTSGSADPASSSGDDPTLRAPTVPGADVVGAEAAKGTCHNCGGSMARGNVELAKMCGACGTRFHASDCGGRLAGAGLHHAVGQCPKCASLCACANGPCACHASNARRSRKIKSALKRQANARKNAQKKSAREAKIAADAMHAASAHHPRINSSAAIAASGGVAKPPTPSSFKSSVAAYGAKTRDGSFASFLRPGFLPEAGDARFEGAAQQNSSRDTSERYSGADSKSEDDAAEGAPGGGSGMFDHATFAGAPSAGGFGPGAEDAGRMDEFIFSSEDEANIMLAIQESDTVRAVRAENEELRRYIAALESSDAVARGGTTAANFDAEKNDDAADAAGRAAERFVRDPLMRDAAFMAAWADGGDKEDTPTRADRVAAAMVAEGRARPGPACECANARERRRRVLVYSGRLVAFVAAWGFIAGAAVKLWLASSATLCDADRDVDVGDNSLWSVPVMLSRQLRMDDWSVSCEVKSSAITALWAAFAVCWHVLCLQAWLGWRFARAYALMWHVERKHARDAKTRAAESKAEAMAAFEPIREHHVKIIDAERAGALTRASGNSDTSSLNDSAKSVSV